MVHGTGQGFNLVHLRWVRLNRAVGKHGFKRGADSPSPNQSGASWVHAHNFFFVRPASHQALNVALSECVIKSRLNVVRVATQCGRLKFGFAHGVLRSKKPGVRRVSENKQRVQRHHFIF
jgi:hypothetical protein